jgi:hypothetical protein
MRSVVENLLSNTKNVMVNVTTTNPFLITVHLLIIIHFSALLYEEQKKKFQLF